MSHNTKSNAQIFITPQWVMGFMSGTSLDGVDVALLKTDGVQISELGPCLTIPYPKDFQEKLKSCIGQMEASEHIVTQLTFFHQMAAEKLLGSCTIQPKLAGLHGQTIFYKQKTTTEKAKTVQIADAQALSNKLNIPVIFDMRQQDIQNGGHGAPLVPIFHKAFLSHLRPPAACINVGGVCNATVITDNELHAADIGPGCALLNDWMFLKSGLMYDEDGTHALHGKADQQVVEKFFYHPFFDQPFPKALDRNEFHHCIGYLNHFTIEDGAATLCMFIALSIARHLPTIDRFILCGGGRHNKAIQKYLQQFRTIINVDELGMNGDFVEAYAWAFLASRAWQNLPLTFPHTTGVTLPCSGGKIVYPSH